MKSGFKLMWSERALADLQNTIDYLTDNWTERELRNFAQRVDRRINLIISNPNLFPATAKRKNLRRSVLTKHNVIYYKVENNLITIIAFFDSRQSPKKLKV